MNELSQVETSAPSIQNVMLIDDNPEHAAQVRKVLEEHHCRLTVVRDGGQAHGTFEIQRPDCVLTELIVRGESGFELCEWIKMKNKSVPVLVLTEINLDSSRRLAGKVGADGYLTKPFSPTTLWDMITDIGQAVWKRTHPDAEHAADEQLQVRFSCRCGRHYRKRLHDAGKSFRCTECNERVLIPLISELDRPDFRTATDDEWTQLAHNDSTPMQHLMIQCTHCATSFHLFTPTGVRVTVCPKCSRRQTGVVAMSNSQLTRAALSTCGRVFAIRSGAQRGKKMLVPEKKVYIGRIPPADIVVPTQDVSRRHCSIKPTPEGLRVMDLGSRTGTFVNGRRIQEPVWLRPGDIVKVGSLSMQLVGQQLDEEEADVPTDIELNDNVATAEQAAAIVRHHWTVAQLRRAKASIKPVSPQGADGPYRRPFDA